MLTKTPKTDILSKVYFYDRAAEECLALNELSMCQILRIDFSIDWEAGARGCVVEVTSDSKDRKSCAILARYSLPIVMAPAWLGHVYEMLQPISDAAYIPVDHPSEITIFPDPGYEIPNYDFDAAVQKLAWQDVVSMNSLEFRLEAVGYCQYLNLYSRQTGELLHKYVGANSAALESLNEILTPISEAWGLDAEDDSDRGDDDDKDAHPGCYVNDGGRMDAGGAYSGGALSGCMAYAND